MTPKVRLLSLEVEEEGSGKRRMSVLMLCVTSFLA